MSEMTTGHAPEAILRSREATAPERPGEEDPQCERCGRPGTIEVAGRRLCPDCYSDCGSCCLEFGADDLWALRDDL